MVLIVEDNLVLASLLYNVLDSNQVTAFIAHSASEALITYSSFHFASIILDLSCCHNPTASISKNEEEEIAVARFKLAFPTATLILSSGSDNIFHLAQLYHAIPLQKPWSVQSLLSIVKRPILPPLP